MIVLPRLQQIVWCIHNIPKITTKDKTSQFFLAVYVSCHILQSLVLWPLVVDITQDQTSMKSL